MSLSVRASFLVAMLAAAPGATLAQSAARVPYARLVEVLDAVQNSGVDGLTFLTAQQDTGSRPVGSKGLQMRVVNSRP